MSEHPNKISIVVKNLCLLLLTITFCIVGYSFYIRSASYVENQKHDYQLVQLGDSRKDQYLLDKRTGRTWSSVCVGGSQGFNCDGEMLWDEQLVIGLNGYSRADFRAYMDFIAKPQAKQNNTADPAKLKP